MLEHLGHCPKKSPATSTGVRGLFKLAPFPGALGADSGRWDLTHTGKLSGGRHSLLVPVGIGNGAAFLDLHNQAGSAGPPFAMRP